MRELVRYFKFFYRLKGRRLISLLIIMVSAALFDILVAGMFLPILERNNPNTTLGKYMSSLFGLFHVEYSFLNSLIMVVIFCFVRNAFLVLKTIYVGKVTAELQVDLQCDALRRLFDVDYQYYMNKETGFIINAITMEFIKLTVSFTMFMDVLFGIIFAMVYLGIALALSPWVTMGILVIGIPSLSVIRKINMLTKDCSLTTAKDSAQVQKLLIQILHFFKYFKATFSYQNILQKTTEASRRLGNMILRQSVLQAITSEAFGPFVIFIIACLLYYQVMVAGRDIPETLFLLLIIKRAVDNVLAIQQVYRKFLSNYGSIYVFENFRQELNMHRESESTAKIPPDFNKSIRFDHVSFRYLKSKEIIKNVSFVIPPRTTIAFVGPSGSGKSTLVTLLTGILKPTAGKICLGDNDYETLDKNKLRAGIGYVTQESVIFNDTIANNIALWNPQSDKRNMLEAVSKAHIKDFIEDLPEKYDSPLGDNGIKVSGGQRQRIGIARELFKEARLLIFDEATSSLDTHAEKEIQKNIDEFKGEKTIILVAHRLSTVVNSDIIFVMKDGEIVEQGSYHALCLQKGVFRAMVDQQRLLVQEAEG